MPSCCLALELPNIAQLTEGCLRLADARLLPSGLERGQPATCDVVSRPSSDRLAAADICVGARKPPLLDLGNRPGRRCDRIHIGGFYRNVLGPKGRSEGCNVLVDGQGIKRHVFGKTRIGVRVFRIALLAIRNAEGADRIQTAATLIGTGLEYLKTQFSSRENFRPPPCLAIDASPQIDGWPPFRYRS